MNERSIKIKKEIPKINCKLNKFINEKEIYELSKKTELSYNTIKQLYYNKYNMINLDTLARLCYVFKCKPSDLLEYEEEK